MPERFVQLGQGLRPFVAVGTGLKHFKRWLGGLEFILDAEFATGDIIPKSGTPPHAKWKEKARQAGYGWLCRVKHPGSTFLPIHTESPGGT